MTQLAADFTSKGILNLMTSSPVATGLAQLILILWFYQTLTRRAMFSGIYLWNMDKRWFFFWISRLTMAIILYKKMKVRLFLIFTKLCSAPTFCEVPHVFINGMYESGGNACISSILKCRLSFSMIFALNASFVERWCTSAPLENVLNVVYICQTYQPNFWGNCGPSKVSATHVIWYLIC